MISEQQKKEMLEYEISFEKKTIYTYKNYSYESYNDALKFAVQDKKLSEHSN